MGQELTATPLQIANSLALLANGGYLMTPHILLPSEGEEARSTVRTQVIQTETADWLRRGPLVDVVSKGTGKKAAIPGYRVFGKTGTAQKVDPETGEYSRQLHVSSFVCGAPADHPRAVVIVSVDEPSVSVNGEHFGGSVAAPAAGRLLRKVLEYLRVPPEVSPGRETNVASESEGEQSRR
jgi:cell division protein FtsI/penicillin-binding protein 2